MLKIYFLTNLVRIYINLLRNVSKHKKKIHLPSLNEKSFHIKTKRI